MDSRIFKWFHGLAGTSPILDGIIIFFAAYVSIILLLILLYAWYREKDIQRRLKSIVIVALSVLLARGIVTEVIRFVYDRPRPFVVFSEIKTLIGHNASAAFPSGHAAFFFALGVGLLFSNRSYGIFILVMSMCMGIARVMAGIHWPLDIVVGALIGALAAGGVERLFRRERSVL